MTDQNNKDVFGIALGVLFILIGLPKLIGVQAAIDNFNNWQLGDSWRYAVGLIEVVLGGLMFVSSLKKYAAFIYFSLMPAAAIVHIVAKEYFLTIMPVVFGVLILVYLTKQNILRFK